MAMIKCPEPECNNMISDQAAACPKCGRPVRRIGVDRLRFEYEKRFSTCLVRRRLRPT